MELGLEERCKVGSRMGSRSGRHPAGDPPAVADGRVLLQRGAQGGDLLGQRLQLPCSLARPEGAVEVVGAVGGIQGEHLGGQRAATTGGAPLPTSSRSHVPLLGPSSGLWSLLAGLGQPPTTVLWNTPAPSALGGKTER